MAARFYVLIVCFIGASIGRGQEEQEEEVPFVCATFEDHQPCNEGPLDTCNMNGCTYTIVGYEDIEGPGIGPNVQRPVIEWSCPGDATGVRDYDRFLTVQACIETNNRPATRYSNLVAKQTTAPCFYVCACAGCSVGPGDKIELDNRFRPGSDSSGNPGKSKYDPRFCNEFSQGSDNPSFGDYRTCEDSTGTCPVPPIEENPGPDPEEEIQ